MVRPVVDHVKHDLPQRLFSVPSLEVGVGQRLQCPLIGETGAPLLPP